MAKFTGISKVKLNNGKYVVRVTDGDMEFDPITEQEYRFAAFKPEFEDLQESTWLPPSYKES
ncbi:MAG: hypothetical protein P8I03_13130 [Thalassotalea sp.]|nr:hypothetical protein [Thalassotalea sp.]